LCNATAWQRLNAFD